MFSLIALAVAVYLVVQNNKLGKRVQHLEQYLQQITQQPGGLGAAPQAPAASAPVPHAGAPGVTEAGTQEMPAHDTWHVAPAAAGPNAIESFIDWVKDDWLMKLGGLLIVLGMGWFVSYAIGEGWIGEFGRIALGLFTGAVVLGLGRYRIAKFVAQGSTLMVVGAAVVFITLFAAQELYAMFPPMLVLVLLFATACLLGITSVMLRHRPLAYANVLLAAVAPMLINAPDLPVAALFTYLLVIAAGAVWVAVVTGWRGLTLASLVIVGTYSLPILFSWAHRDVDVGLLFAYAFTVLFFGVSIMGMRVVQKVHVIDLLTSVGTGVFLLLWILAGASEEWQSVLLIAWTVVFACGAYVAVRLGAGIAYFYSYAGVGVVFLGVATALELDGPTLTIAAIIEAALVLVLGYRITGNVRSVPVLALPCVVPLMLSLESLAAREWRDSMWHEDAIVVYLLIAVMVGLGAYFYAERLRVKEHERSTMQRTAQAAWIGAGAYGTFTVWLVSHALFTSGDAGTMAALFVYTLVAIGFFIRGRASGQKWHRYTAIVFLVLVVGRLLLVEVWDMAVAERFVTFTVIGVALTLVAWFARERGIDPGQEPAVDDTAQH